MSRSRVLLGSVSGQLGGMALRLADEARHLTARGVEALRAPSHFRGHDAWRRACAGELTQLFGVVAQEHGAAGARRP